MADLAGIGKNVVESIDKERLQGLYTTADGKLIKPEKHAKFFGIEEFKLHNGQRYETHIHWITCGKKK